MKHDLNGDGYFDEFYSRYAHLSAVDGALWTNYSPGQRIGLSGSTGTVAAHLHVDFRDTASNPGTAIAKSLPWSKYYYNVSQWKYGEDLDFLSGHVAAGRTFYILCSGKTDGGATVHPVEVKLWVRQAGTSDTWRGYTMNRMGTSTTYVFTIPTTDFASGTTVEYFFSGKRDLGGSTRNPYVKPR